MQTLYGLPELNGRTIFLLFKRLAKKDAKGCMLWSGANCKGYGMIGFRGRPYPAHRFVWSMVHGPIPKGMFVCHKCDTPACCNVDHLFIGTAQENLADMREKNRHAKGRSHGNSKLTDAKAREVVRLSMAGKSQKKIGAMFGVNQTVISEVTRGVTWSHATGLPKKSRGYTK